MSALTDDKTIAAVITPPGEGGIGMIRLSGSEAFKIADRVFAPKKLSESASHSIHFGTFLDGKVLIDEVLAFVFRAPASYTGEDVIEFSFHGSPFILKRAMEVLMKEGARHANAGEFTLRAFMNAKLDLSQAEAVADLISANSEKSHQNALQQMRGGFSNRIAELRKQLLNFASLIELELDFSQEDVEFADRKELYKLLHHIRDEVKRLSDSFRLGNVIKKGVPVVIAGRPNAGKSTLLNAFLEEERALVSDIPGTTRDTIEDTVVIDGISFRFIDTAGLHETEDRIERMGIERTYDSIAKAVIVIYLFDVNQLTSEDLKTDLDSLKMLLKKRQNENANILIAGNKIDLQKGAKAETSFKEVVKDIVFISSTEGTEIESLKSALSALLPFDENLPDIMVSNIRHYASLNVIQNSIDAILKGLDDNLPSDLLSIDIRKALEEMGELTGTISNEDVLGNIFANFCIGK